MCRKVLLILGILIFLDIIWFGYVNVGTTVDYNYKPFFDLFQMDSGMMIYFMAIYSALGTYLICQYFINKYKDRIEKLKDEKIKELEEKVKK